MLNQNYSLIKRRNFLHSMAAGIAFPYVSTAVASSKNESRPPNIVLIMGDDLGMECLGCYGGTSYSTPNIDALAEEGIRFNHCYSMGKCVPSRITILTGRYPFRNYGEWGTIPEEEMTFGHVLQACGYQTALAGKWQLSLLHENPAFVHRMGFHGYSCWAWHEGPRYFYPVIWQNEKLRTDVADQYGPDVYCGFLKNFIRSNKDKPFLAYYPMNLPHFAKTGGDHKEPPGPDGEYQTYSEMISQIDRLVGELVETLEEEGLRENTVILFTGDNGTPQQVTSKIKGRTIKGGKGTLTDAGTHVPLIVNWPGRAPKGTENNDLIDFSDFLPTLADLAGIELVTQRTIDGVSFAPQIKGEEGQPREWAYSEWNGCWVRTHRWKLYEDQRLFDMQEDPEEESPISEQDESSEAARAWEKLSQVMRALKEE